MQNFVTRRHLNIQITFICSILFSVVTHGIVGQAPFLTTWKTDNPGTSNSSSIRIQVYPGSDPYSYDVDWENDGTWDDIGVAGSITHDYGVADTFTVAIRGNLYHIYFGNSADRRKLLSIDQWGDIQWSSMHAAFWGCSNMVLNAIDTPDLSHVTDMYAMFRNCTAFNGDVGGWNTSNITSMRYVFAFARAFNQDIGGWNTQNVENMSAMFYEATAFNQDIGSWNTAKVTDMTYMFNDAEHFNQDIGGWDTGEVTSMAGMFQETSAFDQDIGNWNTGKVESMNQMFYLASSFNQDISNWNTEMVSNMSYMFFFAPSFNQDLGDWDTQNVTNMQSMFGYSSFDHNIGNWDVSNVIYMTNMFQGVTLSEENYDSLLIGWVSLPSLQANVDFHGGASKYCDGALAKQMFIDTYGWTITDGGAASASNTWIGPISGDWNDPANWASGNVPKLCDDVTVPSNINITVSAGEEAYCNSLIVGSGVIVNVEPGATLYVVNP